MTKACDCGGLQKAEAVVSCKSAAFLKAHLTFGVHVGLVTNQGDGESSIRVLPDVVQPFLYVLEAVPPRDVVDQQRTSSTTVVFADDAAEAICAGAVPTLQTDSLPLYVDIARTKLYPYGAVLRAILFVGESEQEASLSCCLIADEHELEKLGVVRHPRLEALRCQAYFTAARACSLSR